MSKAYVLSVVAKNEDAHRNALRIGRWYGRWVNRSFIQNAQIPPYRRRFVANIVSNYRHIPRLVIALCRGHSTSMVWYHCQTFKPRKVSRRSLRREGGSGGYLSETVFCGNKL
uniref:Secreted protein n=1 Tax=Parascaris univalens TaxID=6257 RepID=A0A914ZHQ7_PARUN